MQNKKRMRYIVRMLLLVFVLGACTQSTVIPETEATATAAETLAEAGSAESTQAAEEVKETLSTEEPETSPEAQIGQEGRRTAEEIQNALFQEVAENQLKYAPEVRTLPSGVQVQRTPDGQGIYNTFYLKADERGCYACHEDLNEALLSLPRNIDLTTWMPATHLRADYVGDMKVTVDQCISCHEHHGVGLNTYIHSLHKTTMFQNMGGSCESCHIVTDDGSWELWDEVRYDVLSGVVDADATQGTFTWDQDTVIPQEELFVMDWLYETNDFVRYEALKTGDNEGEADLMDTWTIHVVDLYGDEKDILLKELIENVSSVTVPLTMECVDNQPNGGLIGNVMLTGLPIQDVLVYANVSEGVQSVYCQNLVEGEGLYPTPIDLDWTKDHDVLLVYQIDGQPLHVENGYPLMLWTGGMAANCFKKQAYSLTCVAEHVEMNFAEKFGAVIVNQGVMHTQEGQIIEVGVPYTFEGFAFAYDHEIASVEFSLDRGETWASFETADAIDQAWVYWHYTFTPAEPGAYVLEVQCRTTDGLVSERPFKIMVNAK